MAELADELTSETRIINLYGHSKVGKTTTAMTMSEFCPPEGLPCKERTVLKDTLLVQFDLNGSEVCKSMKAIPYVIDLSSTSKYIELANGVRDALKEAQQFAKDGGKVIVLDTMTALAIRFRNYLLKMDQYKDERGQIRMYGKLGEILSDIATDFSGIPGVTILALYHTKTNQNVSGAKGEEAFDAKNKAEGVKEGDVSLELIGGARAYWRGAASANWPVIVRGGKRIILPYGGSGYDGGCRWLGLERKGEPAHLRNLLTKITELQKGTITDG